MISTCKRLAITFCDVYRTLLPHPPPSTFHLFLSTRQTLVPAVGRRQWQPAGVWACHSQWWCIGQGRWHTEQAYYTGVVWILYMARLSGYCFNTEQSILAP